MHPYTELDISEDPTGKPTAVQMKIDGQPNTTADFSAVGQVLGSALGRALAPDNQFGQIAVGTVAGAIGQKLAQAFTTSLLTNATEVNFASAFANFDISLAGAGAGSVASFLTAELGHALGLSGFNSELFNASIGSVASGVANKVATEMLSNGLSFEAAIGTINFGSAALSAAYSVSGALGGYLGRELVPAQTHAGAVGGQLLGAVGSAVGISVALSNVLGNILGGVLNFIVPGIGSLIGTIAGTLIGDAVASHPHPAAVDLIDQAGDRYSLLHSQISASDGGDYAIPDPMATAAVSIINAYLGAVKGIVLDRSIQTQIGYVTDPDFRYIDGWAPTHHYYSFVHPDDAVHRAALDVLQHIEVIGGDLLLKRAHANSASSVPDPEPDWAGLTTPSSQSRAEKLVAMSGDLSVAQDYENYLNNREAINALIAANPNSAFAAGWIATFARVKDLGLNHTNASDFLGGLVGYLDSVNKAGLGAVAGDASVSHGGVNDSVITVAIKLKNGVEIPGSLSVFADLTTVSSDASGQTVQLQFGGNLSAGGLHRLLAGATAGDNASDVWFGGDAGVSFTGSAGHDILAGGAGNDVIHGGDGWDFVQGGAGNDQLFGDAGNDILRGGPGNDVLNGGAGFDVAVFGGNVGSYTLVSYNGTVAVLTRGTDGSDRLQGIENLQFTDTTIAPGAAALFDGLAYIASYPELILIYGANPQGGFDHYVGYGFAEGRTTSFDPLQYLASNVDLLQIYGPNPLGAEQHYISYGYYEGRQTHSFDPFEYLASNVGLLLSIGPNAVAAERHYVTYGYSEGRPTHSFDAFEYLASNVDLLQIYGPNPLAAEQHYVTYGYYEGRPTHSFDAFEYLASNVGLLQLYGPNALAAEQHYVSYGYYEGRPTQSFDPMQYLASNVDLLVIYGPNPLGAEQHYVSYGYYEGRPTQSFDAFEYLASNVDLLQIYGPNPLGAERHYVTYGYYEGRPTQSFDASQYLANYADLRAAFGGDLAAAERHYVSNGYYEGRTDKAPAIAGDAGDNTLLAANGAIMTGGAGADAFAFDFALLKPAVITDFAAGADHLQISASGFGHGLAAGGTAQLVSAATAAAATHAGSDGYFIFDNTSTLWWDPTGGSGADAVALAKLSGLGLLHASDFMLA